MIERRRRAERHPGLVVALLGMALLAWTLGPVLPSAGAPGPVAPSLPSDPRPATGPTAAGPAPSVTRPDGISASVLDTISTENGTTRPGDHEYSGAEIPANVTAWGNRVFVIGEYSYDLVIVNASTGAIVSAPDYFGCPTASAIDPVSGTLFVADGCREALYELDPESGALIARFPLPEFPQALAFDPVHGLFAVAASPYQYAYATNGTLLFVNPLTGGVVGQQTVGIGPATLAIDPASNLVFVDNYWSGNLSVVSTVTHALVTTLSDVPAGTAVSYDPTNGEIYVASPFAAAVQVFNGTTAALVTSIVVDLDDNPIGLTYDPVTGDIVVVGSGSRPPVQFIAANNTIAATFSLPSVTPTYVTYSAAANRLFISDLGENALLSCNATTVAPGPVTPLGTLPQQSVYDPTNGFLYVVNEQWNNLTVINTATQQVIGSIATGESATSAVYDPADGLIYVTNPDGAAVDVVNPALGALVQTIPVGGLPLWIVYDPVDRDLFVMNVGSNNVSVLSGTTGALLRTIGLGYSTFPYAAAVDPTTGTVWLDSQRVRAPTPGNLTPVNATTLATGPSISLAGFSSVLSYDPGNGDLLVSEDDYAPALVEWTALVSPTTGQEVANYSTALTVFGPADWDAAGGFLAVPNYATNELDGLFGASGTLLPLVPIGEAPYSTTVDPASGVVYASNWFGSSVSAVSVVPVPSDVEIATDPSSCGGVILNGSSESGYLSVPMGIYPAQAPACYGYVFEGWSASGGVTVSSPGTRTTNVTILSNGTLTASFALTPGVSFGVDVGVSPASCSGAVELAGSAWSQGDSVPLPAGSYPILAEACSGETFQGWDATGGVSIVSQGPDGGLLTVAGNGTVDASYVAASTSSSGYSSTELIAFVAAGVLGGALVGVAIGILLAGRRGRPPAAAAAPPPVEPPAGPP